MVVLDKVIRLMKAFYQCTSAQICVYEELTDFRNKNWCQDCLLSPTLFNYAIGWKMMDIVCWDSRGAQISL